jgi:Lipopolysaccharide-assembly
MFQIVDSNKMKIKACSFLFVCFMAWTVIGCGYHLAGTGTTLPEHIKTIGVPIFANNTQGYQVEQKLTGQVTNLLIQRGKYKVVPEDTGVDALLKGTIQSVSLVPVVFGSDGVATQYNVIITARVTFTDKIDNKILFENPSFTFRGQYDIDPNAIQYFDRQTTAVDKIAKDFAESIVSAILEGF